MNEAILVRNGDTWLNRSQPSAPGFVTQISWTLHIALRVLLSIPGMLCGILEPLTLVHQ